MVMGRAMSRGCPPVGPPSGRPEESEASSRTTPAIRQGGCQLMSLSWVSAFSGGVSASSVRPTVPV